MTEFKIGISDFTSTCVNQKVIENIAKTLVAMSNTVYNEEEGLLIIGIADTQKTYCGWCSTYKEQPVIVNQHYIVGISAEAKKLCKNTDKYYRQFRYLIDQQPISAKLKEFVLETFAPYEYHGKEVLIFRSKHMGEVSLYDDKEYIRHASETRRVHS